MKCPYCMGTSFTRGQYDLAQVVDRQPVLLQNVPSYRCKQCGYLRVSAQTMKKIEKVLANGMPDTFVPSNVYNLAGPVQRGAAVSGTPFIGANTSSNIAVPAGT